MVTGPPLDSIARSDNYLIGGVLWTHPKPFHDGDDNYDDRMVVMMMVMMMMNMIRWSVNDHDDYDRMVMMV